jgi:uncharacterized glyoxalase superfamily protein PhnB
MSIASKPLPKNWPRIAPALSYEHAAKAIDWLCTVFGFEVRIKVEGDNGTIAHSELELGEGLIMVAESAVERRPYFKSPSQLGGANTQWLMVYVDDVDAHCARARAAGATIATEPKTVDYGDGYWADRGYEAVDLDGHHWYFAQRVRG